MEIKENFKYAFAEKDNRCLCIKYNNCWEFTFFDYLTDKEYKLTPASEQHWNKQIDEVGRICECYLLDEDLQEFNVGNY